MWSRRRPSSPSSTPCCILDWIANALARQIDQSIASCLPPLPLVLGDTWRGSRSPVSRIRPRNGRTGDLARTGISWRSYGILPMDAKSAFCGEWARSHAQKVRHHDRGTPPLRTRSAQFIPEKSVVPAVEGVGDIAHLLESLIQPELGLELELGHGQQNVLILRCRQESLCLQGDSVQPNPSATP